MKPCRIYKRTLESGVKHFISLLQIKLLNTAPNMDNFSVVVYTVGLGCHHKDFHVYGHQDVGENYGEEMVPENLHFVGKFSKFKLVDADIFNRLNRCVFKPVVGGFSPYVFIAVTSISGAEIRKICEVEFM